MLKTPDQDRNARLHDKLSRELGPEVCACFSDASVIEILLNADGTLWVERGGRPPSRLGSLAPIRAEAALATIAAAHKTTITRHNPILECELPLDGSRRTAWLAGGIGAALRAPQVCLAAARLPGAITAARRRSWQSRRSRKACLGGPRPVITGHSSSASLRKASGGC